MFVRDPREREISAEVGGSRIAFVKLIESLVIITRSIFARTIIYANRFIQIHKKFGLNQRYVNRYVIE